MSTPLTRKIVTSNRKARFDYHIEDTVEAGIMLTGSEVKSLRTGKANIIDAHAAEMKGEIYLFNAYIPEYSHANNFNHVDRRPRKLLLKKKEINKLIGKLKIKGLTLVALSIYFNEKNRAKVELALAKGKTNYDKRETKKDQDWAREQGRVMRDKKNIKGE
jgi:SsrA-binding protein